MQKLIERLLQWQGFERKDLPGLELYGCCEQDKTSYWLVVHGEPDLSPECQAKWLGDCKRATVDPALEKNINLLIAWQTDSLNERTSKLVHHVEEDSYFFKKHVLPYTADEFEALQQQVEKKGLESVFRNILTDTETFAAYKAQHLQGGWQNLLYRLVIKVPTLKVQGSSRADLASLEQNIREKILSSRDSDMLLATESALLALVDDQTPLQEISPEELLALLSAQLKEAGYDLDC